MPFQPLNLGSRGRAATLTIDVVRRLRISAEAMRELKLTPYNFVVISVDVDLKRIGVAKQELAKVPNATVLKLDKRGYLGTAAGKQVIAKLALSDAELPCKFEDIGWVDDVGVRWRGFELSVE
jgi:hypothetical protein